MLLKQTIYTSDYALVVYLEGGPMGLGLKCRNSWGGGGGGVGGEGGAGAQRF